MRKTTRMLCKLCSVIFDDPNSSTRLVEGGVQFTRLVGDIVQNTQRGCSICYSLHRWLQNKHEELFQIVEIQYVFRISAPVPMVYDDSGEQFEFLGRLRVDCSLRTASRTESDLEWEYCLSLAASAEDGDHTASLFTSRPNVRDFRSDDAHSLVQKKISECDSTHHECERPNSRPLPSRIIYVGNPCRVIETSGQSAAYLALSYCWGMAEQPVMAKTDTIASLLQSLPMSELPSTILDAIHVTRQLNLEYLWIDSLCIIQDDKDDKDAQIGRIPEIFSNAHLTICAASTSSCEQSFLDNPLLNEPHIEGWFEDFELPFRCPNGARGQIVIQPWVNLYLYHEPIHYRAWTLEERLLSPRVLIYGTRMLAWQCQTTQNTFECHTRVGARGDYRRSLKLQNAMAQKPNVFSSVFEEPETQLRGMWVDLVEDYTSRALTSPADRLRAIAGLASRFQGVFRNYEYKAGLWHGSSKSGNKSFLLHQLLWEQSDSAINTAGRRPNPIDPCAPSWSWASVSTQVSWFSQACSADTRHEEPAMTAPSEVLKCVALPTRASNPFGRVEQSFVVLEGPLRTSATVQLTKISDHWDWKVECAEFDLDTFFSCQCDRRVAGMVGTTLKVSFLRLVEYGGLMLLSVDGGGAFTRIGVFKVTEKASLGPDGLINRVKNFETPEIDEFFGGGSVEAVTVI